jgi:uncharacterized protein (DUF305 family)
VVTPWRWLLLGVVAVVAAAAVLMLWARPGGHHGAESAVDAGFARDMSVHHAQAVQMASYTRANAPTREIELLASTIVNQQQLEIGQLLGWLEAWGEPRASDEPAMAWMTGKHQDDHEHHSATQMPGMATPREMDQLVNLKGKRLEVHFLQLMIRHHQGGLPMAKEAAQRASHDYVRSVAGQMVLGQAEEIDQMVNLLSARGGKQLPAP